MPIRIPHECHIFPRKFVTLASLKVLSGYWLFGPWVWKISFWPGPVEEEEERGRQAHPTSKCLRGILLLLPHLMELKNAHLIFFFPFVFFSQCIVLLSRKGKKPVSGLSIFLFSGKGKAGEMDTSLWRWEEEPEVEGWKTHFWGEEEEEEVVLLVVISLALKLSSHHHRRHTFIFFPACPLGLDALNFPKSHTHTHTQSWSDRPG